MDDETRREEIDRELEQLRKDSAADLTRLIVALIKGDTATDSEKLGQVAVMLLRQQQITHATVRHMLGELRLLRRDVQAARTT